MYNKLMNKLNKNDQVKIKIIDMTHEGTGIGKLDGFPIFVSNALKDELMDVHIIKVTKTYAVAKPIKIYTKSKNRVQPFCDIFNQCGGCDLQHINYEEQLNIKKKIVENNLVRIGGFKDIKVDEILKMDNPFEYRNKVAYPIKNNKAGFYAKRSHNIIENDECKIQDNTVNKIMNYLKGKLNKNIRHVVFRTTDEGIMVIFVSKVKKTEIDITAMTNKFPTIKTVVLNHNNKQTNVIMGHKNITLFGKGYIEDTLLGNKYRISPNSFYQINKIQTEKLYKKAIEFANINKEQTVFDLYCGIGTIALTLAKKAKKVIGIEYVSAAIKDMFNLYVIKSKMK